jgi:hypothetical protein
MHSQARPRPCGQFPVGCGRPKDEVQQVQERRTDQEADKEASNAAGNSSQCATGSIAKSTPADVHAVTQVTIQAERPREIGLNKGLTSIDNGRGTAMRHYKSDKAAFTLWRQEMRLRANRY